MSFYSKMKSWRFVIVFRSFRGLQSGVKVLSFTVDKLSFYFQIFTNVFIKSIWIFFRLSSNIYFVLYLGSCHYSLDSISNSDVVVTIGFFVLTVVRFDPASVLFVFDQLTELMVDKNFPLALSGCFPIFILWYVLVLVL